MWDEAGEAGAVGDAELAGLTLERGALRTVPVDDQAGAGVLEAGEQIGAWAFDNFLRPQGSAPAAPAGTGGASVSAGFLAGPDSTLQVSSSGLTSATSNPINVTQNGSAPSTLLAPAGSPATDLSLTPLVFDSPDLWDGLTFKKRSGSI